MKSVVYLNKLNLAGPQNLLCSVVLCYDVVYVYVQKVTFIIHGATHKSLK